MKLKEYSEIIEKTAIYPKEVKNFDVAYCYLGVLDEFTELSEKFNNDAPPLEIMKEQGDVIWYLTALANFFKISVEQVFIKIINFDPTKEDIAMVFSLSGKIKKYYRDNKEIPVDHVSKFITFMWNSVTKNNSPKEIEQILQMNYDKLIARRDTGTLHGDGDNREIK